MPPGLLLLLLASVSARAQEAPASGPATPLGPDTAPPAPDVLPEPLGARFVWELRPALGRGARPADLAVQPGPGGAWFVVDERGGVWLSEDEGARWERVLRADGDSGEDELPDDEALLLEAESLQEEALQDVDVDVDPGDLTTDEAVDASAAEALEDVEAELDAEAGAEAEVFDAVAAELLDARGGDAVARPIVWVDPGEPDRVFVGRADGVWRSSDAGRTWERVSASSAEEPQVTVFARGTDGALIAGTVDGVRFSLDDGVTWIDAEDATDGARVHAIVQEDAALWAATSRGLFRSTNGLAWSAVPLPDSNEVRAVVPDPAWETGFWVATSGALLRTDDGGASFYVAGRQPLGGLRDMLQLDEPGHLLAISDNGVWESMDGGVAWTTADRQLRDPDVRAIAFGSSGAVIATPRGVWRLVAPRAVARKSRIHEEALSLPKTIEASIDRSGMDIDLLSLSRVGVLASLAPALEVSFDYDSPVSRTADYGDSTTTDVTSSDWSLVAKLCWGGCSSTISSIDYDGVTDEILADSGVYVSDGEVFDEGEPVAAAANVAQKVRSYRSYLADHVADAWLSRSRLVAENSAVAALPLREQVLHALQIEELDARLDALTDGAFRRSITRTEESR